VTNARKSASYAGSHARSNLCPSSWPVSSGAAAAGRAGCVGKNSPPRRSPGRPAPACSHQVRAVGLEKLLEVRVRGRLVRQAVAVGAAPRRVSASTSVTVESGNCGYWTGLQIGLERADNDRHVAPGPRGPSARTSGVAARVPAPTVSPVSERDAARLHASTAARCPRRQLDITGFQMSFGTPRVPRAPRPRGR